MRLDLVVTCLEVPLDVLDACVAILSDKSHYIKQSSIFTSKNRLFLLHAKVASVQSRRISFRDLAG